MNDYCLAAILGIVEGLTEFLPVSSTAHIRIAQFLCRPNSLDDPYWKLFAVAVQLPAILAVVVYFWPTLWKLVVSFFERDQGFGDLARHPLTMILLGVVVTGIPAAILKGLVQDNLSSLKVMGAALLIGGVVMAIVDTYYGRRERRIMSDAQAAIAADQPPDPAMPMQVFSYLPPAPDTPLVSHISKIKWWQAIWIGLVQVLAAVFPGTSRSMCTIAAGQIANLTRAVALEYSFFLSIPLMFAATAKDMKDSMSPTLKTGDVNPDYVQLNSQQCMVLMVGSIISFLVALGVIAWFMAWVRRRGFLPFAVYRVIIGTLVLFAAFHAVRG